LKLVLFLRNTDQKDVGVSLENQGILLGYSLGDQLSFAVLMFVSLFGSLPSMIQSVNNEHHPK